MRKKLLATALGSAVLFASAGIATAAWWSFGQGWGSKWDAPVHPNPATITWGFAPDGTQMAASFPLKPEVTGTSNVGALRSSIDGTYGAGAFDAALQRAMNTWSKAAGVTFVGPVADAGLPFGDAGAYTPDIRIGAFTPVAGSGFQWVAGVGYGPPGDDTNPNYHDPVAGDIILNLNVTFRIHDLPEGAAFNGWENDLEGLLLHELGHAAMGLGHPVSGVPEVMYVGPGCCTNINRIPSPDDLAGARSVYGPSSTPECNNGFDDDGDGSVDGADDGCNLIQMAKEQPQCSDGVDNDGDTAIDHPADTLCQGRWDDSEVSNPGSCGLVGLEAVAIVGLGRLAVRLRRRSPSCGEDAPPR